MPPLLLAPLADVVEVLDDAELLAELVLELADEVDEAVELAPVLVDVVDEVEPVPVLDVLVFVDVEAADVEAADVEAVVAEVVELDVLEADEDALLDVAEEVDVVEPVPVLDVELDEEADEEADEVLLEVLLLELVDVVVNPVDEVLELFELLPVDVDEDCGAVPTSFTRYLSLGSATPERSI